MHGTIYLSVYESRDKNINFHVARVAHARYSIKNISNTNGRVLQSEKRLLTKYLFLLSQ